MSEPEFHHIYGVDFSGAKLAGEMRSMPSSRLWGQFRDTTQPTMHKSHGTRDFPKKAGYTCNSR